jgi:DNA-binding NtrC family response regulator
LHAFCAETTPRLRFTQEAVNWLFNRRWQGNVRELRNVVDRVSLMVDSAEIDVAALEDLVEHDASRMAREVEKMARAILALPDRAGSKLEFIERVVLHHAIEMCAGNKSKAARLIGVERRALDRRWARLSDAPEGEAEDEDE